jgi:hypothetical protein
MKRGYGCGTDTAYCAAGFGEPAAPCAALDEVQFKEFRPKSFQQLLDGFREYQDS